MVAKLRYLPDLAPGYRRVRRGRGFYYTDSDGNRITDEKKIARFRALVIPPAWKQVWISPSKRGHLQATGVDEEGRKQYLYHPEWTKERQRKKLQRMVAFGNALPGIRRQIAKDLRVDGLTKEKAIAIALKVTEKTLIRVGNDRYLRKYGSRGLTTLKKSHVHLSESEVVFRFRGKKGVQQEISVRNVKLIAHLLELRELTGQYLFQYVVEGNRPCRLRAGDINAYIQRHTDLKFSSKDYRTWYAGFWAFSLFGQQAGCDGEKEREAAIVSVLDAVSQRLGNTRAVCKHYYVPDSIIAAYKDGSLQPYLCNGKESKRPPTKKETERQLLAFLACSVEEVR